MKARRHKTTWQWVGLGGELALLAGVVWCATYDAWLGTLAFVVWLFVFFGTFVWLGRDMDSLLDRAEGGDAGGHCPATRNQNNADLIGRSAETIAPLHPVGKIRIDDIHYQARCDLGYVETGVPVKITGTTESELVVEPIDDGA